MHEHGESRVGVRTTTRGLGLAPTQPTQSTQPTPQINFDQYFQLIGRMLVASQDGELANYMVVLVALQVRCSFRWMPVEVFGDADLTNGMKFYPTAAHLTRTDPISRSSR